VTALDPRGTGVPSLRDLLDLHDQGDGEFLAASTYDDEEALYGGQVAAQALMAAACTVPSGRLPHSVHCYFLRAGSAGEPTRFVVANDRDGRSFSNRRVVASQGGQEIFTLSASFHTPEDGIYEQRETMPVTADAAAGAPFVVPRLEGFEVRRADGMLEGLSWPNRFWARSSAPVGDDPAGHACALLYLSDISTGLSMLERDGYLAGASIDHAMWFHGTVRMDDWVLADLVPVVACGGRAIYRQGMYDSSGRLMATVMQEALLRRPRYAVRADPGELCEP
jgi:acyl-CoA thioesterase-2